MYIWIEKSVIQFICCTVAFIINIDSFKIILFLMEKVALKLLFWNFLKKRYDVSHSRHHQGILFLFALTLLPLLGDCAGHKERSKYLFSCKMSLPPAFIYLEMDEIVRYLVCSAWRIYYCQLAAAVGCRNFINPVKDFSNSKPLFNFVLSYWATISSTITSVFADVLLKL